MASSMEKSTRGWDDADDEDVYVYAMQLASFSALPMTLKAALDLGLLQLISAAAVPLSSGELAARLGLLTTNPHVANMIERILRLLTSYSILSFSSSPDAEGRIVPRYGTTRVCKYLTIGENGGALALLIQDKILMENWYHIKEAVVKGTAPFNVAYGMTIFEYCEKDSRFNTTFNKGMKDHTSMLLKKVLDAYQGFHGVHVVVDVGGGVGHTLNMIISQHSNIKGINFDLPHVVSQAPPIQGVEHISGDMFEVIPSGDVILLKCILHDWSDECCIKILTNCQKALSPDGKVMIIEYIIPRTPEQTREAQVVFNFDMMMLTYRLGGRERTEEEYKALAKQSGFNEFKLLHINSNTHVIELSN